MRRTFWIGIYVGLLAAVGAAPASGTPQKQEGRAAPTLPAAGIVMHPSTPRPSDAWHMYGDGQW